MTPTPAPEPVNTLIPPPPLDIAPMPSPLPYDPSTSLSLIGWIAYGVDNGYCLPASTDLDLESQTNYLHIPLA
jgi:hypothetical protein